MEPSLSTKLVLIAACLAASAFFSSSEAALFSLGLLRVRRLRATAQKSYEAALKLLTEPLKLISTLLTGNEVVNSATGIVGSSIVYELFADSVPHEYLPVLAIVVVLPVVVFFGEIVPKTLAIKHPERFVTWNAVPLIWFSELVAPIRDSITWISSRIVPPVATKGPSAKGFSEEIFRSMVDTGTREGELDTQEQRLIHNVFNLDDVKVAQILTPWEKVACFKIDTTVGEAKAICEKERYSRFPVLNYEGSQVEGVLYVKDLLGSENLKAGETIRSWMRTPLVVFPTTSALELFAQFRGQRSHFGVVVERDTRKLIGVVTLDDVLRQIFGEIRDERDVEEGRPSNR